MRAIAVAAVPLTVVLVVVGLGVETAAPAVDDAISRSAAGTGGRAGELMSLGLSRVGETPGIVVACLVALIVARRRRRWRDLALVAVAGTVELTVFLLVSEVVGRDRPPVASPDAAPVTGAFPSGHTAAALAVLGALALLVPPAARRWRRAALLAAAVSAALVGAARVVRGQHRPSEVLAGLALGAGAVAITLAIARHEGWSPDGPAVLEASSGRRCADTPVRSVCRLSDRGTPGRDQEGAMPTKVMDGTDVCRVTFRMSNVDGIDRAWLAGEFNGWSTGATPLERQPDGALAVTLVLEPGRSYRYRFYLGDGRWENDWKADDYVDNDHGGADSVVVVPVVQQRHGDGHSPG